MKTAFLAALFTLLLAATALSQGVEPKCPVISVVGPQSLTNPGDAMVFTAKIDALDTRSTPSYHWEVSAGQVTDGQGTSVITVATTKENVGSTVTAAVTVKGLPDKCSTSGSTSADIYRPPICDCDLDDYGHIPWRDERARLDNFLVQLNFNPKHIGYVLIEIEAGETVDRTKKHILKMLKDFKWQDKDFDLGRLRFAILKGAYQHRARFTMHLESDKLPECGGGCTLLNGKELYR